MHDLGITEKFILANLCIRTGRSSDALKLLEHLVKVNNPPEWVFSNLAGLYIELDRADEGLSLFRWLRTQHQNSRITEGWAILSASAGREDEVISWFDCREEQRITDRLIRDLYYIANDKNKSALALVCAECLYRRHKGIEERFLLGNALLTAGRPYEALQYLRDSYLEGYDKESAYYNALYESFIEGKPVAGEIEDFILTKLSKAGLKDKQTEEFVYILLDINAYETALPFLKKLARKDIRQWLPAYIEAAIKSGRENDLVYFLQKELERNDLTLKEKEGHLYALIDMKSDADITPYLKIFAYEIGKDWMSLYEETLLQMGRRDELLDLWKTQAMKPDISTEKKRSIAFRMLDADFKKSAENVFFELAHESPPDDQDVAGLLFLCGPTPDKSIIAWLEARARSSSGVERAKWVNHLLNVNAVPLAIDIMEADFQQTRQTPLLFDTYLNALVMSGRVNTLSRVIIKETDMEGNPGRLQNFAKLAFQENQLTAATRAYKKLLTLTPDNHEAIKRLGLISFFNGKPSEAESYLSRYISADKGDYEVYYYYGEVLLHKNDGKRAKRYYQLALEEVRKIEAKDLSTKKIQALLLYRNGKINESLTLFRNLLNDAPYDKNLINDFVYVLLEIGDYKEAEKILSAIN
ncbi:MAG: tetratricopeptide repeat protein [Nitrospinae bacterium]|nr:tetratricopeptide repeat protein [Nitrospinota bacterium]